MNGENNLTGREGGNIILAGLWYRTLSGALQEINKRLHFPQLFGPVQAKF